MNDKNTYSVDKYLEIIAEKEGITKEEVQQEIGRAVSIALNEYYGAAEPPVRCGESHLSGLTEPLRSL